MWAYLILFPRYRAISVENANFPLVEGLNRRKNDPMCIHLDIVPHCDSRTDNRTYVRTDRNPISLSRVTMLRQRMKVDKSGPLSVNAEY